MQQLSSPDARWRVQQQLGPGESLLWAGVPRQGLALKPSDAVMIPFSLMWGGFAIFWETTVWVMDAPWFFRLWGVPFVVVGLYLIAGRFVYDAWVRGRTVYAVTNQRVVIVRDGRSRSATSLDLATLPEMTLSEKRDGSGTIVFGPEWTGRGQAASPRFELIAQARSVHETIRAAQQRARGWMA
jgi:hypothetical protein